MQILIQALCSRGRSLREAIANDSRLRTHGLRVVREKQAGRAPGWMKLQSADFARGVLNVEWDTPSSVLSARVITRGSARPSPIVGDFINYLLIRHSRRVKAVITAKT
jgi:hypothetical protein